MISHHHKVVFIHIPKCGGQSIEMMFLKDLGLNWKTRAPLLLRANNLAELGPPRLAHLIATDYLEHKYITKELFDAYYKFSVTRNPYARVVSMFNYLNLEMDFERFVQSWLPKKLEKNSDVAEEKDSEWTYFLRPQAEFLYDSDDRLLVDEVFRLEQMDQAERAVKDRLFEVREMPHVNESRKKRVGVKDLTEDLRTTIEHLYSRDFALLDYPVTLTTE